MVYHSQWNGYEKEEVCGCGVYDVRFCKDALQAGAGTGPAGRMMKPAEGEEEQTDILDETLYYFKAHMLFRTYNIKGPGDRTLLYMTLFVQQCLKRIVGMNKNKAKQEMLNLGTEGFDNPGSQGFVFGSFFPAPESAEEKEKWIAYFRQLRIEMAFRVVAKVFEHPEEDGTGNKFWMTFTKGNLMSKLD
jgi:actin related protein 2/3 complex subunit 3